MLNNLKNRPAPFKCTEVQLRLNFLYIEFTAIDLYPKQLENFSQLFTRALQNFFFKNFRKYNRRITKNYEYMLMRLMIGFEMIKNSKM